MNIYEYQAKQILKDYNIQILKGFLVDDASQIESQARKIETDIAVIKAQIHAGGRGKAGGVKVVDSLEEAIKTGKSLLGKNLITHQTGPKGEKINVIYIEEGCEIDKEFYISLIINRKKGCFTFMASTAGGMEIEEIAKNSPEALLTLDIDPVIGVKAFHGYRLANFLNLEQNKVQVIIEGMYNAFIEKDMSLLEINPLVLTKNQDILALDAKISFDDNALYRQEDVQKLADYSARDRLENEAVDAGLAYVKLEGEIGCLVNGAGLAMATMDAIYMAGGKPANFLDVGGSADVDMVSKGFEILIKDQSVKGIFVNIFGGIMQCDTIAQGILKAAKQMTKSIPIVVRLEGTNALEGNQMIQESQLNIVMAENMDQGAEKIIALMMANEEA